MNISMCGARSLTPTCRAGDVWLHSPYDPEREARRFAGSSVGASKPSHVVLLGPCLDYLTPVLRSLLPGARIISVQYSSFFEGKTRSSPDASWHPGVRTNLGAFLDANLDEDAISGVCVLEWEPASRAFPDEAVFAKSAVRSSLDRLSSSTATVKASGRKWISNSCASFLLIERASTVRPVDCPVIIAAAGPSLNASLAALSRFKGRFTTIAVSSAWAACRHAGIEPDLVVSTDGGFWSRQHLYPLAKEKTVIAAPLTALPSSSLYRMATLLLLDQGSFVESELLPCLGPGLVLAPHGTVSGTALQLAAGLTAGPIIAAGLDLASYGDLSHARPHGFDAVLGGAASRLHPLERSLWSRGRESSPEPLADKPWRSSRSLNAYASALALDARLLSGRLYRFGPSPQSLPGFEALHEATLGRLMDSTDPCGELIFDEAPLPPLWQRESRLAERLASWRISASEATLGMGEGSLPRSSLVAELLRSIDIVDYAAARRAILAGGNPAPAAEELGRRCDSFLTGLQRRFAA
jgi:Protein of unknown function DUF115